MVRFPPVWRFVCLVALLLALVAAGLAGALPDGAELAGTIRGAGAFAPLLIVGGTAALLAAMIPRSVLAAAAGMAFGLWAGAGYVMLGALISAVAAFAVGRCLGYDFVASRRHAAGLNAFLHRRGLLGVLVLRLLPIAPFGLVSYAFGVTAVPLSRYLLATVIGIAPSTIVFASLGANALSPGTPAFAGSVAAAVALAVLGLVGARVVRRRERRAPSASAGARARRSAPPRSPSAADPG
ncbi:MAG TPA: VTT domain-containing protein [Catenuloplanes sp.]|jgi:uncharacterized membrane protein YdjX (TVP38/TMEM64 family)